MVSRNAVTDLSAEDALTFVAVVLPARPAQGGARRGGGLDRHSCDGQSIVKVNASARAVFAGSATAGSEGPCAPSVRRGRARRVADGESRVSA